eukprot:3717999-Alexandrium_andersonii.AAC.1
MRSLLAGHPSKAGAASGAAPSVSSLLGPAASSASLSSSESSGLGGVGRRCTPASMSLALAHAMPRLKRM